MNKRIFLSPPSLSGRELEYVNQAFASGYIAPAGPDIDALEQEMSAMLGVHCVALSSGTAALHLALVLAGVGPGDTVLCSDLTFVASVNPVRYAGAEPVFADSDAHTWNMDAALAVEWLHQVKEAPKALVLTHLYGLPADVDPIAAACQERGVVLIEDAAEALGARYKGRPAGVDGRFGVLSFNGNKVITGSTGGMLLCRHEDDAARARFLSTQAREPAPHYEHAVIGYNYRLSNICAAIVRGQLASLPERVARKREIFDSYKSVLQERVPLAFMPQPDYADCSNWLTCVLFAPDAPVEAGYELREKVRLALESDNIESRPLWKPMHLQPLYAGVRTLGGAVGEGLFLRGLCLPSGGGLEKQDMERICRRIVSVCENS